MTDGPSELRLLPPSVVTCNSRLFEANRGGEGQFTDVMTPQTASTGFSTVEVPEKTTCCLMSEGELKPRSHGSLGTPGSLFWIHFQLVGSDVHVHVHSPTEPHFSG